MGISEIEGKGRRGDRASGTQASFKFVSTQQHFGGLCVPRHFDFEVPPQLYLFLLSIGTRT
jgi:hypothetical protein